MSKRKRYRGECSTPLEHALTSNDNTPYQSPTQLSHRSTLLHNSRQNMTFYLDVGDCDRVCEFCDALFWYDERLLASSVHRNPRYNHCCKGGAVTLPYQRQYDVDVIWLFERTDSHQAWYNDAANPSLRYKKTSKARAFANKGLKEGDAIEARADIDMKKYFEAIIQVKSCYTVTKYVVVENTSYMPVLKHEASLKIGKKAQFEPLSDDSIPHYFFQFASYDELDDRMKPPKQLTGIVEKSFEKITNTGKTLRKVNLKDVSNKSVQITLWPDKAHLIGNDVVQGDVVAITSTKVTQFDTLKQLESTYSTEVFVNPDFDNIQQHICRLRKITATDVTQPTTEKAITIHDLLDHLFTAEKLKFTCAARIKDIQAYRKWFYVQCSKCSNTLYLELGDSPCYVCKNHDDIEPKFMYCVKATIADETATTNVVFFNQVMTEMLGISCQDMVILKGHDNPKIPPPEMLSKIGVPMTFTLTVKADKSITIIKASEAHHNSSSDALTSVETSTVKVDLTPPTPDPKFLTTKRPATTSTGTDLRLLFVTFWLMPTKDDTKKDMARHFWSPFG
ncbi:hypothetical protein E3N88_20780 [Mikania micrantha]|uniref:Replication protein A OB domain-containing protein n=1 Tax=Mikania micrantha TaxID=192012 RepID=A0A5N6NKF8_9ASTR|nr:hypothetical protein E3N88_20780 [Mikania micrantha]